MPPRRIRNREASDPMADCVLPQRTIMSILSRLPVKSLVRFKGVCKPWQRMFTNPDFIKLHYNRFSVAPKTCCGISRDLHSRNLRLVPHNRIVQLTSSRPEDFYLASCRGLICIARPMINTVRVLLWNPATRLWKVLPQPITNYEGSPIAASVGFGCNEEGDDHKVVRIFCLNAKKMKNHVEVYSSKLDSWKKVKVGFRFRSLLIGDVAVVNGNPHWLVHDEAEEMALLRLDATRMLFKKICLHEVMKGEDQISLVDLEGSLGMLHCVNRDKGDWLERIDVWDHVEVEEEWVMKWRLEGEALRGLKVDVCGDYSWRKGKIVGRSLNGSMFEYDVKNGSVRVFGVERGGSGVIEMRVYEESLAYVRGMEAMHFETPVDGGDDEIRECIAEGFLTWVMPRGAGEVQVYYPLAF